MLAAIVAAGAPLVTTATCDPYRGTLSVFRDRGHRGGGGGIFDWFVSDYYYDDYYYDDYYYDDCCYDDYWLDDWFFFP
jgi:hypothetical protein